MAKRRATRGGAKHATGGSGKTLGGLAVVAAVLAGGTYLYRHTGATSGIPAEPVNSPQRQSRPAPSRRTPDPVSPARPSSAPTASAPSSPADPGAGPSSAAASSQVTPVGREPAAPFGTSEEVFESGARIYAANCAGCHGRPGKNGKGPSAAQFWDRSNTAGGHAIAQSAGSLYQATAKGNLIAGMPSYGQRLTDTQLWDLALLLKSAHDDLPDPVLRLLRGGQ